MGVYDTDMLSCWDWMIMHIERRMDDAMSDVHTYRRTDVEL